MSQDRVRVIGLAGTNGAGKDTVGDIIAQEYGFLFISVTDIMRQELARRGLPPEREHMRALSSEWRKAYGLGVLVDRAYDIYQSQSTHYKGVVFASLRNPYEVDRVHELGGVVAWIDADPRLRYERIRSAKRQGREDDDQKSFEQFIAEEEAEMVSSSNDKTQLNMGAVKQKADILIENHTDTVEPLKVLVKQRFDDII
ncbi:MAG TPA: AAA family ATPase [Candidatus Saccharimonadales bacterium]|nr:AAA family ATPase [Candidatus Saccharimonadales bacterium]